MPTYVSASRPLPSYEPINGIVEQATSLVSGRRTDLELVDLFSQPASKLRVNPRLNVYAIRADAGLTRLPEF